MRGCGMAGLAQGGAGQRVGVPMPMLLWAEPQCPSTQKGAGRRGLWGLWSLLRLAKLRSAGRNPSGKVLFSLHSTSPSVCLPFCSGFPHHALTIALVTATNEGLQL